MSESAVPRMTEKQLSQCIYNAARSFGWRAYRTFNSFHSPKGFPDLCMVRGGRIVFAELKTEVGKLSPEQTAWLADLRAAGVEVYLWRPANIDEAYRVLMSESA